MNERTRSTILTILISLALTAIIPFMVLLTGANLWYLLPAFVLGGVLTFAYWNQPR